MKHLALLLALAALLAAVCTFLILRDGHTNPAPADASSSTHATARSDAPAIDEPPRDRHPIQSERVPVSTAQSSPPRPAARTSPSVAPDEYRKHIDAASRTPFPAASKLLADDFFNPQHKQLSSEQRHELQKLVDGANEHVRRLEEAMDAQVEAHSRELVHDGLGRPVAPGEKVPPDSPEHDSVSIISNGNGSFAVSFAKRSVPEIAAHMDERDEFVKATCSSLRRFFGNP